MERATGIKVLRRVTRIIPGIKNFEWGKVGASSLVYDLASSAQTGLSADKTYAELWMGTHVSGPSVIDQGSDGRRLLSSLINEDPTFYLGRGVSEKFAVVDGQLPYLFKVLSIAKALSIQAHPDKVLARRLFKEYPDIYKDDNHKPEMCIALTDYKALCNFALPEEIIEQIECTPELRAIIGNDYLVEQLAANRGKEQLKAIFSSIFEASEERVSALTTQLVARVSAKKDLSRRDKLVILVNQQFPNDIGIFLSYLLNYFDMTPGQCLVMAANEPHAYISGDCIECMSASDNVVRAGFTPKFKDVKTLCSMLTYEMMSPAILHPQTISKTNNSEIFLYQPAEYNDFSCYRITVDNRSQSLPLNLPSGSILLVTVGSGTLKSEEGELALNKGDVLFIAAATPISILDGLGFQGFICFCTP